MEEPLQLLPGELWVRDGKIEYAGPAKTPDKPFDRTIDAAGDILMPGFKNAHTLWPTTCRSTNGSMNRFSRWRRSSRPRTSGR